MITHTNDTPHQLVVTHGYVPRDVVRRCIMMGGGVEEEEEEEDQGRRDRDNEKKEKEEEVEAREQSTGVIHKQITSSFTKTSKTTPTVMILMCSYEEKKN